MQGVHVEFTGPTVNTLLILDEKHLFWLEKISLFFFFLAKARISNMDYISWNTERWRTKMHVSLLPLLLPLSTELLNNNI